MLTNRQYEFCCSDCGHVYHFGESGKECPKCGGFGRIISRTGICVCGEEVEFSRFTNTCECGRDYNWAGQELACRSQWGEETGETAADILTGEANPWGE